MVCRDKDFSFMIQGIFAQLYFVNTTSHLVYVLLWCFIIGLCSLIATARIILFIYLFSEKISLMYATYTNPFVLKSDISMPLIPSPYLLWMIKCSLNVSTIHCNCAKWRNFCHFRLMLFRINSKTMWLNRKKWHDWVSAWHSKV